MFYFAYGSNMHRVGMAVRCPGAVPLEPARLEGHRFRINRRGVATVVPESGGVVYGLLWTVTEDCLHDLDRYEGVGKRLYRRVVRRVETDGETREAFVYLAADAEPGRAPWAYLDLVLKAARDAGLPPDYVAELEQWG
ncbi:MAG: gamma-glutamylcyclotransferase family protein [Gemmatimonadales bacterium]